MVVVSRTLRAGTMDQTNLGVFGRNSFPAAVLEIFGGART